MDLLLSVESIRKISFQEYLSDGEIDYYRRLNEDKKDDWLAGRFSIKKLIRLYYLKNFQTEIDLQKIKIISKKLQKPTFQIPIKKNHQISISISHCDGYAFGAISDIAKGGLVGVDIERIRDFKIGALKNFLTQREFLEVRKQPKLATLFWSAKEAYLKALGYGLTRHPRFIEIHLNNKRNIGKIYDKGERVEIKSRWACFSDNYLSVKVNVFNKKKSFEDHFKEFRFR